MTNSILLNAILSMDSYNRGYNAGIDFSIRNDSGDIIQESDAPGVTKIGNLTIYKSNGTPAAQAAGFYAVAYKNINDGTVTISYRGTDKPVGISSDLWNGWIGGAGFQSNQAGLAFSFYNDVAKAMSGNVPIDPRYPIISLTGHSLGGGLAGLVGANDNYHTIKSKVA